MSLDEVKAALPDWAKDVRLNIGSLTTITSLDEQQLWGTILATSIASRSEAMLVGVGSDIALHLSGEAQAGAKAAASIMAMNNIYYRFLHLVDKDEYSAMPARLRMSIIANPGVEKADFELWCLAVSAINGCGSCVASHEREVINKGLTREAVQDAVRVASIIHSAAVTLEAESRLSITTE